MAKTKKAAGSAAAKKGQTNKYDNGVTEWPQDRKQAIAKKKKDEKDKLERMIQRGGDGRISKRKPNDAATAAKGKKNKFAGKSTNKDGEKVKRIYEKRGVNRTRSGTKAKKANTKNDDEDEDGDEDGDDIEYVAPTAIFDEILNHDRQMNFDDEGSESDGGSDDFDGFGLTEAEYDGRRNRSDDGEKEEEETEDFASALVPSMMDGDSETSVAGKKSRKPTTIAEDEGKLMAQQIQAANRKKKKSGGFQSMGLSYPIYKAIIGKGYKVPTPIQRKCIPIAMEGKDLVGMARTGSGKTAAFMIPMIEKLKAHSAKVGVRGIVLSPSRELAMQTHRFTNEMTKHTDLRSCMLVGGDSLEDQFGMIASNPDILIATPGRLMHLIIEMELDLKTVEVIVFDEADRLFEMGFALQLHEIMHKLNSTRQTMLFSATLPSVLVDFAKAGLQDPTLIRLDVDTKVSKDLEMAFFVVKKDEKEASLLSLLRDVMHVPKIPSAIRAAREKNPSGNDDDGDDRKKKKKSKKRTSVAAASDHQTIVFVSTKHHVEFIGAVLEKAGYHASMIYGAMDQTARKISITDFREGRSNILVVTDVAARGIDIPILENVVNYDFVDSSKVFVHRVGRAARAGRRGWAYSILTTEELPYLVDLQLFLSRPMLLGRANPTPSYTGSITVGTVPRDVLELDVEWVKELLDAVPDIEALRVVAANGRKLYCKSRPVAAPESYKRAKEIVQEKGLWELHPLFSSENCEQRDDLLASISCFRPSETIFEIGSRGAKKASVASSVMRQRRQTVGGLIENTKTRKRMNPSTEQLNSELEETSTTGGRAWYAENDDEDDETDIPKNKVTLQQAGTDEIEATFGNAASKRKSTNSSMTSKADSKRRKNETNYKDEEYFMSHYQSGANTEKGYSMTQSGSFLEQAQNAQLNLLGDEKSARGAIGGGSSQLRWDAKKKKFVQGDGTGSDNKKMIRTESGAKVSASFKSGRFQEWQNKTRSTVQRVGELEAPGNNKNANKRYRHSSAQEAKPLDPRRMDYERKKRKLDKKNADQDGEGGGGAKPARAGRGGVRNELKSTTEIAKERLLKEQRRAKTGRPSRRGGGSAGRGGSRRGR